jgi:flagellar biosynthesis/type III secretory pathway protein FliH
MSCDRNSNHTARAAIKNGLSYLSGKTAFYAGVAAGAAGLVGGLVLARKPLALAVSKARARLKELARRSAAQGAAAPMINPRRVPELSTGQVIAPTPREKLTEKCAGCGSSPRSKPGAWYVIDGKPHCQDCAPGVARQSKQRLQAPAAPRPAATSLATSSSRALVPAGTSSRPAVAGALPAVPLSPESRVPTTLQRRRATLAMLQEGGNTGSVETDVYAVLTRSGAETGLGLAQLGDNAWTITHLATGMKVAGSYRTQVEAQKLAEILAQLDWTPRDPVARFGTETARRVGATIRYYDEALKEARAKMEGQSTPAGAGTSSDEEEDDELSGLSPAERKAYDQVSSIGHDHGFADGYDEGATDALEELGMDVEDDPQAKEERAAQQAAEREELEGVLDNLVPGDDSEYWNAVYESAFEDGQEEGYWEGYEAVMNKFGVESRQ